MESQTAVREAKKPIDSIATPTHGNREAVPAQSYTIALEFNEGAYLSTYDDVMVSIDLGEFATAREHFENYGRREGRLTEEKYIRALGIFPIGPITDAPVRFSLDSIVCCRSGTALIVGWTEDTGCALSSVSVCIGPDRAWNTTAFGRVRRPDVESALQATPGHLYGFWCVVKIGSDLSTSDPWLIRGRLADGRIGQERKTVQAVSEAELRTIILGYFANTEYWGNRDIESFLALEAGVGEGLVLLNRTITASIIAGAWVSYHGPSNKRFRGSVIVCLYGKHEFMFLQSALFSLAADARDYEFVYVSNSPELTEILEKEARNCARIYGISIVLVCLPGNAGFGAANNVGARFARSDRLLITNPDVFPRDNDWAARHTAIIDAAPIEQTLLFGAPLFYDDGSLMHQGMYFQVDAGISIRSDGIFSRSMIRTEHYGKGAPAWSSQFMCPRPVPAVTGAFISADRNWFEALGGFNEDFLFGHYEDADLCLRSLARGTPAWMQDFPLWHMEGKGSTKLAAHAGGTLVNRWLFTRQWGAFIERELNGPQPLCDALHPGAAKAKAAPEQTAPARPWPAILPAAKFLPQLDTIDASS